MAEKSEGQTKFYLCTPYYKSNSHVSISEEGSSSGTKDICLSYLDHHVPKTQGNAPFLSYENDHDQDHEVINDSSPPPLS